MDAHTLAYVVIGITLFFTYTNGFQDGSSVAATAIGCRALKPYQAILVVSAAEFCGALFGGSAVANAIQSITSFPDQPSLLPVLASGMTAAIVWNFFTRAIKVPSSSTHALVGGVVGAIVTQSGSFRYIIMGTPDHLMHANGLWKVILSLIISPLIGFGAGYLALCLALILLSRATTRINKSIKTAQWFVVPLLAFGHGANDTQKAMGIILLALNAIGTEHLDSIPTWVRIITGGAMVLGIASLAPGIVKQVGTGIYRLRPIHALMAQISAASVILTGSATGGPVAASQIIASSVVGVGSAQRLKGVHWKVAQDMVAAWFFTIPGAAMMAFIIHTVVFHWLEFYIR